jgi:ribosomal-protein-alanine N-acetyltransferase
MPGQSIKNRSVKGKAGEDIVLDVMKEDDLSDIIAIERVSFTNPWSGPLFRNELSSPGSRQMIAKISGRTIGYICSNLIIDEANILDVAVHPDFRGRGVASALIEETMDHLKGQGCRAIFLEVRISHIHAHKMYDKYGFKVIGTRKGYYASPVEDAAIMVHRVD